MKCLLINLIVFVVVVNSDTRKTLFLPKLPVGNYRLNFLAMTRCDSVKSNNKIQFNFYLSKKSVNTTEIKGNISTSIKVDDSINFEFDFAVKDSIGGWKENAFFYKLPKACLALKMFFGNAWTPIMDGVGIYNATCPIKEGFYKGPGFDTALFMSSNFPKTFFYGTYRFRAHFTKNQEENGCFGAVLEVKRPWETD
ncbi:uncharacterized protein LOC111036323 [Myzus persicae]|uniref:uncharacterized protein LOC111036323 n=1 Tax=Myzus persicae TaxID=13164 RepID=UPI000B936775|nr:uncharacterized protein LOC111036323 [Myzus persicae]